ncbi:hypothetical protein HKBW3S06_01543, partial [Candidatus Hakubella thermalkaliphila]
MGFTVPNAFGILWQKQTFLFWYCGKDGKLIVFHDDNLKRVFGKDFELNASPLKELKHPTENRLPTLEEALQFIGTKVERILIELKETGCEKQVLAVIKKE